MATWNKTKIVATIGPASNSIKQLRALMDAGVDVFRLNGAHGNFEEHRQIIRRIRSITKKTGSHTAILLGLPGPKIRIGTLRKEPIQYTVGKKVTVVCGRKSQTGDEIPLPNKDICKSVKKGSTLFLNDGIIELKVLEIKKPQMICRVVAGGELRSHKGMNLPDAKLNIPTITPKDRKLIKLAIQEEVDFVSLSFVRKASDMIALRKMLSKKAPGIKIIAKIEKPEALEDLDNIISASDAVMVARGDLGIEMRYDKIPAIQRLILLKCHLAGKPSITATQMLESMVGSKSPTRAEATDVANAVWEGSDAMMLSEETSIGGYPVAAVNAMAKIALEAEKEIPALPKGTDQKKPASYQAQAISRAANLLAKNLNAKAIVTPTRSGRTALFVSKQRPTAQIIAPTTDEQVARQMNLYWGVRPMVMSEFKTVDELLRSAEKLSLKSKFIKSGDTLVITSGAHIKNNNITNMIEVRRTK
jgi:pyruvate kinase